MKKEKCDISVVGTLGGCKDEKVYSYNEAIDLSGNGRYNFGLLVVLSLSLLAMCIDMFSFSVVINYCRCDFELGMWQKSFLVSIPFLGPVIMAYPWGYISDTQGRKKSMLISLPVSFLMSTLCAFAPNWSTLAALKLIGTCFVSAVQSSSCTWLGESCPDSIKNTYIIIMASMMHVGASIYFTLAYFIGPLDFFYDLGFINFVSWRMLVLVLALPIGLSCIGLLFFHESPKFLLNLGREDEALEILRKIYKANGGKGDYPVKKVILLEAGNLTMKSESLLSSLWEQTAPLFKPPLLLKTTLLFYLLFVCYASNSGLVIWMPFLADAFQFGSSEKSMDVNVTSLEESQGFCDIIVASQSKSADDNSCPTSIDINLLVAVVIQGWGQCVMNIILSKFASRRKALLLGILAFSTTSCLLTYLIPNSISSFLYMGVLVNGMCMGPTFSYFVDFYPTSFRGMATCLGVMAARISSVIGINIVGPFILSQCGYTFYGLTAFMISGIICACILPADRPKKVA